MSIFVDIEKRLGSFHLRVKLEAKNEVLRFMFEKHMISIKSKKAGILKLNVDVDEYVQKIRHLPEFMILIRIQ